jgi:hypothetical protein
MPDGPHRAEQGRSRRALIIAERAFPNSNTVGWVFAPLFVIEWGEGRAADDNRLALGTVATKAYETSDRQGGCRRPTRTEN